MDPILDEMSLVPCGSWPPARRIETLARTLVRFDALGAPRILRTVRDAADRDIAEAQGFRTWCFRPGVDRDAGRLVAQRLGKQPFIDGADGLFAAAEGERAVEARIGGSPTSLGLAVAALTSGAVVYLGSAAKPTGGVERVDLCELLDSGESTTTVTVTVAVTPADVDTQSEHLRALVQHSVTDGPTLVRRFGDLFPLLTLGPKAMSAIEGYSGSEPFFGQIIRHLRALNDAAANWTPGRPFSVSGVSASPESPATLQHGQYGPLRDFPVPQGFAARRWSSHTKPTGGPAMRLYFDFDAQVPRVLIGYIGPHLPTVKF